MRKLRGWLRKQACYVLFPIQRKGLCEFLENYLFQRVFSFRKPKQLTCYIAGPMRGKPFFNFPAFDAAAETLRKFFVIVFNPADFDRERGYDPMTLEETADWNDLMVDFNLKECIQLDVALVLKSDALILLPGWEYSIGVCGEIAIATWFKIPIFEWETLYLQED